MKLTLWTVKTWKIQKLMWKIEKIHFFKNKKEFFCQKKFSPKIFFSEISKPTQNFFHKFFALKFSNKIQMKKKREREKIKNFLHRIFQWKTLLQIYISWIDSGRGKDFQFLRFLQPFSQVSFWDFRILENPIRFRANWNWT